MSEQSRIDQFNERLRRQQEKPAAPSAATRAAEERYVSERNRRTEAEKRAIAYAKQRKKTPGPLDYLDTSPQHPVGSTWNLTEPLYDESGRRGLELDSGGTPKLKDALIRYMGRHDRLAYDIHNPDEMETLLALVPSYNGELVALALRHLRDSIHPEDRELHEVLVRRVVRSQTQTQVASAIGCSQKRVSYLEQEAKRYLKGFCEGAVHFSLDALDPYRC